MHYIFDTNVLMLLEKSEAFRRYFEVNFGTLGQASHYVCDVTHGELNAMARRNGWGKRRWENMLELLQRFKVHSITNRKTYEAYGEVEAYNANKLDLKIPDGQARKMGKNDIWIAVAGLDAIVVTADKRGFSHFRKDFLKTHLFKQEDFK